jgi:hypothetical protein
MKKTFFAVLLAAALLAAGCKERPPTISGRVLEYGTEQPIEGATVKVRACEGEFLGPIYCYTVDSAKADAQGRYSMPFPNGASLANAYMPGYFSDIDSEIDIGSKPDNDADIWLHPHAWIRVTIRNESGAYGFYPDRNQSGLPLIHLNIGQDSTLLDEIKFRKGNDFTKYIFSSILEEGGGTPPLDYWENVKAFVGSENIPVKVGVGASIKFYLPGHDTTDITIIY